MQVAHAYNPSYSGGMIREIMVQATPGKRKKKKKRKQMQSNSLSKRAGGMAQEVEYLLSKCEEALYANPSIIKKRKKNLKYLNHSYKSVRKRQTTNKRGK
jgi:hypothetical protein